jgi:hypothetical protein
MGEFPCLNVLEGLAGRMLVHLVLDLFTFRAGTVVANESIQTKLGEVRGPLLGKVLIRGDWRR